MAYDLHIVRTKDWNEAASAPITRHDVDALVAADPELAWSTTDYIDMAEEAGASTRYYMITWRGQPCFWCYRGQIQCSGPDEAQISKLVQMSQALNAHVVGDDGEAYPLDQPPAASTLKPTAPARKRVPLWMLLLGAFLLGCLLLAIKVLVFGG